MRSIDQSKILQPIYHPTNRPYVPASPFFFFHDTAPTEIYTLSLHDALPISSIRTNMRILIGSEIVEGGTIIMPSASRDRKSTRLNSSHVRISYAVFCLKKKKKTGPYSNTANVYITPSMSHT